MKRKLFSIGLAVLTAIAVTVPAVSAKADDLSLIPIRGWFPSDRIEEEIDQDIYEDRHFFSEGYLPFVQEVKPATKNAKAVFSLGYINKNGEMKIVAPSFSLYNDIFREGMAVIWNKENTKAGYIDKNGNLAVDFIYDRAMPFYHGLALVKKRREIRVYR